MPRQDLILSYTEIKAKLLVKTDQTKTEKLHVHVMFWIIQIDLVRLS